MSRSNVNCRTDTGSRASGCAGNLARRANEVVPDGLSSLGAQSWMNLTDSPEDTVRISTRSATEPGHPIGLILCAVSTTRLPFSRLQLFDFLRDIQNSAQPTQGPSSSSQIAEYVMRESYSNECESVIAYSTMEVRRVLGRTDPSTNPILPLGFVMVPINQTSCSTAECSTSTGNIRQNPDCLLTVGIQALASTNPDDDLNLDAAITIHSKMMI
ncbi:hypothetical protein POM88_023936 [Heracleum sosnowskyi]|uniref:HD-Zip IV C-terminal domain-containing protein n=1 Tax=Heracleum sosnowskyi TaxID=360622 RepID=A0AAD8IJS9_9APIA|nr:hypothetical protein POM88_023932 [Heracleum sosnowskyi]KAK1386201.1 hypothetical protein POM88_023936 [Heracleum sosnowskyi]